MCFVFMCVVWGLWQGRENTQVKTEECWQKLERVQEMAEKFPLTADFNTFHHKPPVWALVLRLVLHRVLGKLTTNRQTCAPNKSEDKAMTSSQKESGFSAASILCSWPDIAGITFLECCSCSLALPLFPPLPFQLSYVYVSLGKKIILPWSVFVVACY